MTSTRRHLIAAVLLLALFTVAVGVGFGVVAERVLSDLSGDAALGWLTFVATTWFAIWSFRQTKRREVEAQLFTQKAEVYTRIVNVIRDLMFVQKGWIPPIGEEELAQRFAEARYDMIVWGGQDTIRAIEKIEEGGPHGKLFTAMADLYKSTRHDLGHKDDDNLSDELILAQIIIEDREQLRQQMANYRQSRI